MIHERPALSQLTPYKPGLSIAEVQDAFCLTSPIIKMASNENPLGSAVSWDELARHYADIHHYPYNMASGLIHAIAYKWFLTNDHVILGNGSDEVILLAALAYLNPGDQVITSECTFSEYRFVTLLMDGQMHRVPLRSDYAHNLDGICDAITDQTKLIFLANPNNPTGTFLTHTELDDFLAKVPSSILVILDEAYAEFATHPLFPRSQVLLAKYPNVLILRTFSKLYGLAGLRIGYGVGDPSVIASLGKVSAPFNVNSLALFAGELALKKKAFVAESLELVKRGKSQLQTGLDQLGLKWIPSEGNFICIFVDQDATVVTTELCREGIIVRSLTSFGMTTAIRVTIGTSDQNEFFLTQLKRILT
jgi:histidinol-phosphate aminotransferase